MDAIASGIEVKQVDSRAFVVAAGQETDLYLLECLDSPEEESTLLARIGRKEQVRKSFLQSLIAIGGTPLVRIRARIEPEEKTKPADDPWSEL